MLKNEISNLSPEETELRYNLAKQLLQSWLTEQASLLEKYATPIAQFQKQTEYEQNENKLQQLQKEFAQNLPEHNTDEIKNLNISILKLINSTRELNRNIRPNQQVKKEEAQESLNQSLIIANMMKSVTKIMAIVEEKIKSAENHEKTATMQRLSLVLEHTNIYLTYPITEDSVTHYLSFAMEIDGAPSKTGVSKAMNNLAKKSSNYYQNSSVLFPSFSQKSKHAQTKNDIILEKQSFKPT